MNLDVVCPVPSLDKWGVICCGDSERKQLKETYIYSTLNNHSYSITLYF